LRRDRTDAEVSQRLVTIEAGIDGLNRQLGKGRTQSLIPGSEAADTLEGFLNAANAFRTSASTFSSSGSTTTAKSETVRGGSVFGDPLSEEKLDKIKRWIPAPTEEGSEGSVTDVASPSRWNGSVQDVESLPQLMSVLENVTQMADRFQALEKQKHFTKDEEIRLLRERCEQQEMKSKELEQACTTANENLLNICKARAILAEQNDYLFSELEEGRERRNMLTSEMNHFRESLTRERADFEGKLEDMAFSIADLIARERELTEEKDILKAKNETLEKEKQDLNREYIKNTERNHAYFQGKLAAYSAEIERKTAQMEHMARMHSQEAKTYKRELARVQDIAQELKEEKAELITKNTAAQAALIAKVESISLAVPQMMQDLVRNLSKQATDFKEGCASLTVNMKETSSEDTGESGVVEERKPETSQSGQVATKEGHGPEKAATPLLSLSTNNTPLAPKPKGVKGPSRLPTVGSNTEDGGCVT
jgi:hypothetical protein